MGYPPLGPLVDAAALFAGAEFGLPSYLAPRLASIALTEDLTEADTVLNELRGVLGKMENELLAFAGRAPQGESR